MPSSSAASSTVKVNLPSTASPRFSVRMFKSPHVITGEAKGRFSNFFPDFWDTSVPHPFLIFSASDPYLQVPALSAPGALFRLNWPRRRKPVGHLDDLR
jgi:hypothetical protein